MVTRRGFCTKALGAGVGLPMLSMVDGLHGSLLAGTGAATYVNPVLAGDHPDAGAIRVGEDFYLTHSSFDYAPGLYIWHSRDLVNWDLAGAALRKYYGSVWAPYLCEYQGHYYIYFPCSNQLHVVHAPNPLGPWSEPVSLRVNAIDPAHVAAGGRRYLHFNGGYMLELSADGLSVKEPPRKVFEPWPIPSDFHVECECLEAPKIFQRGDYFYLTVAEGGTAGPPTSHMVVSARGRNPDGPWEYSPFNPIVHTRSREDRWMSLGHGRLVDAPNGSWWMTLHGYENGFRSLGRQMLLLPVEWTQDGWFRLPEGVAPDKPIAMMTTGKTQAPPPDLSDEFTSPELGLRWQFWRELDPSRFQTGDGRLVLAARGTSLADSAPLTCITGDHSYSVEVDVEAEPGCEAGLLLYYNQEHACGIRIGPQGIGIRLASGYNPETGVKATRATLRIVNDRQVVDFYYRLPGQDWKRTQESAEVASVNHNVLGGFLDLRPALYACGSGHATFRSFRYAALGLPGPGRDTAAASLGGS
jgi:xylan 1,4-beta-xylosidase